MSNTEVATDRRVREIETTWIPMRDGIELAARVWLPEDAEADPVPGILEYIPYRRRDFTRVRDDNTHPRFARAGYPTRAIILRHVLPNTLSPVAAYSMTDAILVILAGASLGFLGMGAQPPTAEWGVMIADGQPFVQQAWWICLFPGLAMISLGLGLAFLGDALGSFRRRVE